MVTRRDHPDRCARCYAAARSAAILAAATGSIGASQSEQTALSDPARPGQEAPEHGATVRRVVALAVPDPDDLDRVDPPIYEGPTRDVGRALAPGRYAATATVKRDTATTDTVPCAVTVHPSGAVHLAGAA